MPTILFTEILNPKTSSLTQMGILYLATSVFLGCLTTLPRIRMSRVAVLAHRRSRLQRFSLGAITALKRTFGLSVLSCTKC
jgi:hypothetical protein